MCILHRNIKNVYKYFFLNLELCIFAFSPIEQFLYYFCLFWKAIIYKDFCWKIIAFGE